MLRGDTADLRSSTHEQCPELKPILLNMVPLIPHVQSCHLDIQADRFAIPVGDPRMVKTDSLPTQ
jgi:hypothetical protein